MPLALDLLLWLGPRLSLNRLAQPFLQQMGTFLAANAALQPQDIQNSLSIYGKFLEAFNLLGFLRTLPIGVSSLMSGVMPTQTPLGAPAILEISSVAQGLGLSLLLTLIGWMLGGLYFRWVAALAAPGASSETFPAAGRAMLQTVFYAVIWSILLWVVVVPVTLVLYVFFAINTLLGQLALLVLALAAMWMIVPIFFSPHGIFVRKQNALASILSGFRLTRFTLPTSSLFVLTILLAGVGLNVFLWSKPADDSWLVVVGIFGHAFVTTALLASSFVYYDKMSTWLQLALERLRAGLPGRQI